MEDLSPTAEAFRRLAHDLRGPLAVISGNVQYLQAVSSTSRRAPGSAWPT